MTLKKAFENIVGKKRKCWLPAFSCFPTIFSTIPETNFEPHSFCHLQMLSIWTSLQFCRLVKGKPLTTQSLLLFTLKKKAFENIVVAGPHFYVTRHLIMECIYLCLVTENRLIARCRLVKR